MAVGLEGVEAMLWEGNKFLGWLCEGGCAYICNVQESRVGRGIYARVMQVHGLDFF